MQNFVLSFLFVFATFAWNSLLAAQEVPGGTVSQNLVGCFKLSNTGCDYQHSYSPICDKDCVSPFPNFPVACPKGAVLERVVSNTYPRVRPAVVGETGHSQFNQQGEVICAESRPCSLCGEVSVFPGFSLFICTPTPGVQWAPSRKEPVLTPVGEPCQGNAEPQIPDGGVGIG